MKYRVGFSTLGQREDTQEVVATPIHWESCMYEEGKGMKNITLINFMCSNFRIFISAILILNKAGSIRNKLLLAHLSRRLTR